MTDTLVPPADADYYQRVADLATVPFWHLGEFNEPIVPERPHVWHGDEVVPELVRSQDLVGVSAATLQRRALLLRNPGLAGPGFGATHSLVAAYQMLLPGEAAPVHAHSFSALRFGIRGHDAAMVVDGEAVPLHPGDLLLTPAWSWHGHVHPGGGEPVIWFDGLDVPTVMALRAGFFRDAPPELAGAGVGPGTGASAGAAAGLRESTGTTPTGPGLEPAGQRSGLHSPIRRYPWEDAYPALQRLMARADGGHGAALEYRNPIGGGPALATIACSLQGVPAGGRTGRMRETAKPVCLVARGRGSVTAGGERHELRASDVMALPAWTWHELHAADDELVVFRMSDRPLQDAVGLYRAETAAS